MLTTLRLLLTAITAAGIAVPAAAHAFSGFHVTDGDAKLFSDATQVVLMRHGDQTALSMQSSYEGPVADFAMVVAVPGVLLDQQFNVLDKDIFDKLDRLSAPRLVEYWEADPCDSEPPRMGEPGSVISKGPDGVRATAQFKVGEYDVEVLSASESSDLDRYLRRLEYRLPDNAEALLRPYVDRGMQFLVAKVDADRVAYKGGRAVLSPLQFTYKSDQFELPIRPGMMNSNGEQDLVVYVLAQKQRYEVANYANRFIPTNIEVRGAVSEDFGGFYRAVFDRTLAKAERPVVVTEYAWDVRSCDPCPSPALTARDLTTLGAEAVGGPADGWVLTRLHTRYARDEIGEDFVFAPAAPVEGGMETSASEPDRRVAESLLNRFQARYLIRHRLPAESHCEAPKYQRWRGLDGGIAPSIQSAPSINTLRTGLAAHSAGVALDQLLLHPIPEVRLRPAPSPIPRPVLPSQPEAAAGSSCTGCHTIPSPRRPGALALLLVGASLLYRRRA